MSFRMEEWQEGKDNRIGDETEGPLARDVWEAYGGVGQSKGRASTGAVGWKASGDGVGGCGLSLKGIPSKDVERRTTRWIVFFVWNDLFIGHVLSNLVQVNLVSPSQKDKERIRMLEGNYVLKGNPRRMKAMGQTRRPRRARWGRKTTPVWTMTCALAISPPSSSLSARPVFMQRPLGFPPPSHSQNASSCGPFQPQQQLTLLPPLISLYHNAQQKQGCPMTRWFR